MIGKRKTDLNGRISKIQKKKNAHKNEYESKYFKTLLIKH